MNCASLRSFNQSGYQQRSNSYSSGYGDSQRSGGGFKGNTGGMSSGGFKSGFRNNSTGYQNRNGNDSGFRNGGDRFGGNRGGDSYGSSSYGSSSYGSSSYGNQQSFGGQRLKSVEWGGKSLRPLNKSEYVPHPAITSRSPFEVGPVMIKLTICILQAKSVKKRLSIVVENQTINFWWNVVSRSMFVIKFRYASL